MPYPPSNDNGRLEGFGKTRLDNSTLRLQSTRGIFFPMRVGGPHQVAAVSAADGHQQICRRPGRSLGCAFKLGTPATWLWLSFVFPVNKSQKGCPKNKTHSEIQVKPQGPWRKATERTRTSGSPVACSSISALQEEPWLPLSAG